MLQFWRVRSKPSNSRLVSTRRRSSGLEARGGTAPRGGVQGHVQLVAGGHVVLPAADLAPKADSLGGHAMAGHLPLGLPAVEVREPSVGHDQHPITRQHRDHTGPQQPLPQGAMGSASRKTDKGTGFWSRVAAPARPKASPRASLAQPHRVRKALEHPENLIDCTEENRERCPRQP